jgi:hypothetical protein
MSIHPVEQQFAELMAAARDLASGGAETTRHARTSRPAGRQMEPLAGVVGDRARRLVEAANAASPGWVSIRLGNPTRDECRAISRTSVDEFEPEDWAASYDLAVRQAARDLGLDARLRTWRGGWLQADQRGHAGYDYRCQIRPA